MAPAMTQNELGDRLAILMRRAGLKNGAVAEATGVDITTVSKWRSGNQRPDRAKLLLIVELLKRHGVAVSVEQLSGESDDGALYVSSRPIASAMGVREPGAELRFSSPMSAQKGRIWVEQFLHELAEGGASEAFIADARRHLLNPDNYQFDVDRPAGKASGMSDDEMLDHMKALAEGVRAALKLRKKWERRR